MKKMANHKIKGLLRGLRYISQVFDHHDKEDKMKIGYPTDVKHVAHVGWHGSSVTGPSWMNLFQSPHDNLRPGVSRNEGIRQKNPTGRDLPDLSGASNNLKDKHRKRSMAADASEGNGTSTSSRKGKGRSGQGSDYAASDTFKMFRRKKSKESASVGDGGRRGGSPKTSTKIGGFPKSRSDSVAVVQNYRQ